MLAVEAADNVSAIFSQEMYASKMWCAVQSDCLVCVDGNMSMDSARTNRKIVFIMENVETNKCVFVWLDFLNNLISIRHQPKPHRMRSYFFFFIFVRKRHEFRFKHKKKIFPRGAGLATANREAAVPVDFIESLTHATSSAESIVPPLEFNGYHYCRSK